MVKKITKYLKFAVCCTLILSLIAPSYAALSASDGSAFVTKAEFDSALADFNARLTTFEAGINSKIDSQVTSYLDRNGIWNGAEQTIKNLTNNQTGNIRWPKLFGKALYETNTKRYNTMWVAAGRMNFNDFNYGLINTYQDGLMELADTCTQKSFLNIDFCKVNKSGLAMIRWAQTITDSKVNNIYLYTGNYNGDHAFMMTAGLAFSRGTSANNLERLYTQEWFKKTLAFADSVLYMDEEHFMPYTKGAFNEETSIFFMTPLSLTPSEFTALFFVQKNDELWIELPVTYTSDAASHKTIFGSWSNSTKSPSYMADVLDYSPNIKILSFSVY